MKKEKRGSEVSFLFAEQHRGVTHRGLSVEQALPSRQLQVENGVKKNSHSELYLNTGQSINDGLGLNYHQK